jgi:microcompartment protein CcmK/EutM
MKAGRVIGRVTLNEGDVSLKGARWLLVVPMGAEELTGRNQSGIGSGWSAVVYDNIGAGEGDTILYVEGSEATQPFSRDIPLDAINVAILDTWKFED